MRRGVPASMAINRRVGRGGPDARREQGRTSVRRGIGALCLAASLPFAAAAEQREEPGLLRTMSVWLQVNFDLPTVGDMPLLVSLPAAELALRRYGPHASGAGDRIVALYDDAEATIFVSDEWTGDTVAERSVLLHELVHHLQATAGMRFACAGERELLAYRAQDAWLGLFGESLEGTFGIDSATLLVATTCTY